MFPEEFKAHPLNSYWTSDGDKIAYCSTEIAVRNRELKTIYYHIDLARLFGLNVLRIIYKYQKLNNTHFDHLIKLLSERINENTEYYDIFSKRVQQRIEMLSEKN